MKDNIKLAVILMAAVAIFGAMLAKDTASRPDVDTYLAVSASSLPVSQPAPKDTPAPDARGEMVWVSAGGEKYHKSESCSGMGDPAQITLTDAIDRGYEPCKRCYKN